MATINRHGHRAGQPRRRPRFHPRLRPRPLPDEAPSSGRLRFRPRFPRDSFHPGLSPDKARYPQSFLHPRFPLGKAPWSGNRHCHQQKQHETWNYPRDTVSPFWQYRILESANHCTQTTIGTRGIIYRCYATCHLFHIGPSTRLLIKRIV
jgi:hypothetical protein